MKLLSCGTVVASMFIFAGAALADGQAVYTANCAGCHAMMKPKLGDKAAWAPLIAEGTDTLTASVIKGKGMMGPKGGHVNLSDADIKAAVQYMEDNSK